jgi:tetratricopeptide (TPR) repeat protein
MTLTRPDIGIALALAACTAAVFGPAFHADFVAIDDPVYVTRNRHVADGLTAENAAWAWSTFHQSNWHPLTWFSLQLDATRLNSAQAGPDPFRFHATNVLLHAANAALAYLALNTLTAARWRSLVAAVLFAFHPLRVESVTWVSERKDVLSVFFGLAALLAYAAYVRRQTVWTYITVVAFLLLSLLSKPMLVTFPFLLLVLDWWPLGRITRSADWKRLVVEKVPLFALCLASSVVTFVAQHEGGSVRDLASLSAGDRCANALVAYATYLAMTAWPLNLAPFYPYQEGGWPGWRLTLSAVALVAISAIALRQRQRRPYLLAGWLWYLGTLVPVIGLVQVGSQAFADRYSYFPSLGLSIAMVWLVADILAATSSRAACAIAVTSTLAVLTWRQGMFWKDDLTLWPHTVDVTGPNAHAYSNVGIAYENRDGGDVNQAIKYYDMAVKTNPGYGTGQFNLARALRRQGHIALAMEHYRAALRADPRLSDAHNDLGTLLSGQGHAAEAEEHFRRALAINSESALAHRNLGSLLENSGRDKEALAHYQAAVRFDPQDGQAFERLGVYFGKHKDYAAAVDYLRRAAELEADSATAQRNVGVMLEKLGRVDEAVSYFRRAVEIDAKDLRNRLRLATALAHAGDTAGADKHYRQALELNSNWPEESSSEAWKLATSAETRKRNGDIAVWAAESACNAVRPPPAKYLDALAAAYAEAGRFADAVATAEKALAAAESAKQTGLAQAIGNRLVLYREKRPFRESPASGHGGQVE